MIPVRYKPKYAIEAVQVPSDKEGVQCIADYINKSEVSTRRAHVLDFHFSASEPHEYELHFTDIDDNEQVAMTSDWLLIHKYPNLRKTVGFTKMSNDTFPEMYERS